MGNTTQSVSNNERVFKPTKADRTFSEHKFPHISTKFSHNGKFAVTKASHDIVTQYGEFFLRDGNTFEKIENSPIENKHFSPGGNKFSSPFCFSDDSKYLALITSNKYDDGFTSSSSSSASAASTAIIKEQENQVLRIFDVENNFSQKLCFKLSENKIEADSVCFAPSEWQERAEIIVSMSEWLSVPVEQTPNHYGTYFQGKNNNNNNNNNEPRNEIIVNVCAIYDITDVYSQPQQQEEEEEANNNEKTTSSSSSSANEKPPLIIPVRKRIRTLDQVSNITKDFSFLFAKPQQQQANSYYTSSSENSTTKPQLYVATTQHNCLDIAVFEYLSGKRIVLFNPESTSSFLSTGSGLCVAKFLQWHSDRAEKIKNSPSPASSSSSSSAKNNGDVKNSNNNINDNSIFSTSVTSNNNNISYVYHSKLIAVTNLSVTIWSDVHLPNRRKLLYDFTNDIHPDQQQPIDVITSFATNRFEEFFVVGLKSSSFVCVRLNFDFQKAEAKKQQERNNNNKSNNNSEKTKRLSEKIQVYGETQGFFSKRCDIAVTEIALHPTRRVLVCGNDDDAKNENSSNSNSVVVYHLPDWNLSPRLTCLKIRELSNVNSKMFSAFACFNIMYTTALYVPDVI